MLRLFRFSAMMLLAFLGGIMFERAHQRDVCEGSGGEWLRAGICGVK